MKRLFILIVILFALVACNKREKDIGVAYVIMPIDGHDYVVFKHDNGVGAAHSESCKNIKHKIEVKK